MSVSTDRARARWGEDLLFDNAPCGYVITRLDGQILDLNDTFLRWTGLTRDALVGQARLSDLLTPGARMIHEIRHLPSLQQAGELHDSPSEFVCADGQRLPVMISSALRSSGSADGEVVVHAVSNASARREYERELRRARDEERAARTRAEELAKALARRSRREAAIAELGRLALAHTDAAALVNHTAEMIATALHADGVTVLHAAGDLAPGATLLTIDDGNERDYFIAIDGPVTEDDLAFLTSITQLLTIAIQRRESDDRHRHLALHDPLTGLSNRTLLLDRLNQALARQERDRKPLALMMIDLDRFKAVNDTYGHHVGDELLRHIAARLAGVVRVSDTAARIGGDEFAVLCEGLDGGADADEMGDRIRDVISEPVMVAGQRIEVGASVGIVMASGGESPDALFRAADATMYRQKSERPEGVSLRGPTASPWS